MRAALLTAVVFPGALVVFKNFPYVHFSDGFIIALDLFHQSAAMAFLAVSCACLIAKKRWVAAM